MLQVKLQVEKNCPILLRLHMKRYNMYRMISYDDICVEDNVKKQIFQIKYEKKAL